MVSRLSPRYTATGTPMIDVYKRQGADRSSYAPNVRDVVTGSHELCASERKQIPELRVRSVIYSIVSLHGKDFAVFVCSKFDVHKKGRSLPVSYTHLDVYKRQE